MLVAYSRGVCRGTGGRGCGSDPKSNPQADPLKAEHVLRKRQSAGLSKFKQKVSTLVSPPGVHGELPGDFFLLQLVRQSMSEVSGSTINQQKHGFEDACTARTGMLCRVGHGWWWDEPSAVGSGAVCLMARGQCAPFSACQRHIQHMHLLEDQRSTYPVCDSCA